MATLQDSTVWVVDDVPPQETAVYQESLACGVLSAKVFASRDISIQAATRMLHPSLERDWHNPCEIAGMQDLVERLLIAYERQEDIVVFGDYDVDGLSATTIMYQGLRALGFEHVRPFIPQRTGEGYGLSRPALARLKAEGIPQLIVTVDNGIASADEIDELLQEGIDVVVSDHHELGEKTPHNVVVCNPKCVADSPSRDLAGAGVALKIIQALCTQLGSPHLWKDYLELATLGTIADVMSLTPENRALVSAGVKQLHTADHAGLVALAKKSNTFIESLTASELPFSLIPRLNAAGRMDKPQVALSLLMAKHDTVRATQIAQELDDLNQQRRELEEEQAKRAIEQVEREGFLLEHCVVVASKDFHEGVKGIVASRVMNAFNRPSLVFTIDEDGIATGSGRSAGPNLFEALLATQDLLIRFGGHKNAVGVTLHAHDLEAFAHRLNDALAASFSQSEKRTHVIDVSLDQLDVEAVEDLARLEPFGNGNSVPLFATRALRMRKCHAIGEKKNHIRFELSDGIHRVFAIQFRCPNVEQLVLHNGLVDVVFEPLVDTWRSSKTVKLRVRDVILRERASNQQTYDAATSFVDELFSRAPQILAANAFAYIGHTDSFFTKIVGVTHENRQEIIARLQPGERLLLEREPHNPYDANAIALLTHTHQQAGYLRKEIAQELASHLDAGEPYYACVQDVTGGKEGQSFGVNIEVKKASASDDAAEAARAEQVRKLSAARDRWRSIAEQGTEVLTDELRHHFIGDASLLPAQIEALKSLALHKNTLCVMATGRGKSLIFHIHAARVALLEGSASIFVFPLRALVNDQAYHLEETFSELGLVCKRLTGESSAEERSYIEEAYADAAIDVILTTPEYLALHPLQFAAHKRARFLVIDEAHHAGTSKGGNRSSYQDLPRVLELLGSPTVLAVTATANDETAREICSLCRIEEVIKDTAIRSNLHIKDERKAKDRLLSITNYVAQGEKCVIYVNSRDQSISIARNLRRALPELGHKIAFYNAGLTKEERKKVELAFRQGKLSTIVSTSAFGEGVNIGNIRHVMLYHMPFGSVEFNQMSGRAGRDGKDAYIHVLFNKYDACINRHILSAMAPSKEQLAVLYKVLMKMHEQAQTNGESAFVRENASIADSCVELAPKIKLDAKGVSCGIAIFKELGFLRTFGYGVSRHIEMIASPEKAELTTSIRFREGLRAQQDFSAFSTWIRHASATDLLHQIDRPIVPSFGTEVNQER